jgi:hypothetical protein
VQRYALRREEAAASLGMSVDTFERRVQPFVKVVACGQLVIVPPAEIERWCGRTPGSCWRPRNGPRTLADHIAA